jgi:DNA integrity scanning protein DisA with diadenylate cyclase activity
MIANKTNIQQESNFPKIAQPALRALQAAGFERLEQLSNIRQEELSKLHGMGPKAIKILNESLGAKGLTFKK